MIRPFSFIGIFFFTGMVLMGAYPLAFAAEDTLDFSFRRVCEEGNAQCRASLEEDEDGIYWTPNGEETLEIFINNPNKELLNSFRAKIRFDIKKVELKDLKIKNDIFTLSEPLSNKIDAEEGVLFLGGSISGGARNDTEFPIATLRIRPITADAELSFLNYQNNELGDTGIYFTSGFEANNLLLKKPRPLRFQKSSAPVTPWVSPKPPVDTPSNFSRNTIDPSSINTDAPRVINLQVRTESDGTTLFYWPMPSDDRIKGFYLYYSQKSGYYLRRRDMGKTNFAEINDLPLGEKYYFAVTAYNKDTLEGDYSNEVFVTIGNPGSESHPFIGDPREQSFSSSSSNTSNSTPSEKRVVPKETNITKATQTENTGPEHITFFILLFGVAALGASARLFS